MTKQTNEELREKIRRITCQIFLDATEPCHGELILTDVKNLTAYDNEIISLISSTQPECKWKQWSEGDTFDTDCGGCFSITEGSIEENDFKYCPYCGKSIKVINEEE